MSCFHLFALAAVTSSVVAGPPECYEARSLLQTSADLYHISKGGKVLSPATPTAPQGPASPLNETQLYQQLDLIGQQNGGFTEGFSNQYMTEMQMMNQVVADQRIKTICETGFNGGHGTLRWLLHSNPQAHVYSFDLGAHPYSKPASKFLQDSFPGRHTATWGDSTQTLPQFHQQNPNVLCNLIFVDGGHDKPVAAADLKNFMAMADPSYNVVMIDDVTCSAVYCVGPNAAWGDMIQGGQITQTLQSHDSAQRGFALGTYKLNTTGTVS